MDALHRERKFECEGCERLFGSRKALSVHEKACKAWLDEFGDDDAWDKRQCARDGKREERSRRTVDRDSDSDDDDDVHVPAAIYDSDSDSESEEFAPKIIDAAAADTVSEQHRFINLFAQMRSKFASNEMVDTVRSEIKQMMNTIQARSQKAITAAAEEGKVASLHDVVEPVQAALASVSSSHRESVVREKFIPSVKPVKRTLGTRTETETLGDGRTVRRTHTDVCYDLPFEQVLEQVMQNNKDVYKDVLSSSDRWMQQPSSDGQHILRDLCDGLAFQRHSRLNREALRASDAGLTLALGFYGDGVTIACPIGPRRANSKIELFYWFSINIQPDHRLSLHNIQLATIAMTDDVKRYGCQLVISGGDADGSFNHSTSFGASMHRLNEGVMLTVPNPMRSEGHSAPLASIYTRGWCPLLIADSPAASTMLALKASVAAFSFCRGCDACKHASEERACPQCDDSDEEDGVDAEVEEDGRAGCVRRAPNSFLPWRIGPNGRLECPDSLMSHDYDPLRIGARQLYNVRSMEQWRCVQQQHDAAATRKERLKILKRAGIASFRMGTLFPHWEFWGSPQDLMHVEFEGLLKDELYLLLHEMHQRGWITAKRFNQAKNKHRFSGGVRLSDITSEHFQGAADGLPKRNYKSLPFTAHDMLLLVTDSIELLAQFILDWDADFWRSWLLHVEYVCLMLSDAFSFEDVRRLDDLIFQHQSLFLTIKNYKAFWVMPCSLHRSHSLAL